MLEDGGENGKVYISSYPKCFSHVVCIELEEQKGSSG